MPSASSPAGGLSATLHAKGNPDGSLSHYPSLRNMKATSKVFDQNAWETAPAAGILAGIYIVAAGQRLSPATAMVAGFCLTLAMVFRFMSLLATTIECSVIIKKLHT